MKAKKVLKPKAGPTAAASSIASPSNGILKKKNKNKSKKKNLMNAKLLKKEQSETNNSGNLLEATVSGVTALPLRKDDSNSPKRKDKKKNKKKDRPTQQAPTTNNSTSDAEKSPQKPPESTSNASAKPKQKKKKKKAEKENQAQAETPQENTRGSDDHQETGNATTRKKKMKKGAKQSLLSQGVSSKKPQEVGEEKDRRTIFVGNVSTKTSRQTLSRFFSKYGKVETVRLRCAAVPSPATSKKEAVIRNKYHEHRDSLCAYVRFTQQAMVEEALKANGAELDNKHLHVDTSQINANKRNTKLAVFIGNLPFEAEEEALRSHFITCGEVESVRIVRDKKLASGKGFGYVNFKAEDAVEIALQMNGQVFMHRQLRVQRCTKQNKKRSNAAAAAATFKTKKGKKGLAFMKKTNPTATKNTKKPPLTFSGKKMMETKKFKKMKAKAKFTKEDRRKKAMAHKLAGGKNKKVAP